MSSPTSMLKGIFIATVLFLTHPNLAGEKTPDPPLQYDWFKISVIIFVRPEVTNENTQEYLFVDRDRAFPYNATALPGNEDQIGYYYSLSPATIDSLIWPTLDMLDPILNDLAPQRSDQGELLSTLKVEDVPINIGIAPVFNTEELDPKTNPSDLVVTANITAETDANSALMERTSLESAAEEFAEYETLLEQASLLPLSETEHLLQREANRLRNRDDYEILFNSSWTQAIPDRQHPLPILIQAGNKTEDMFLLEGTIAITLGRYLHARAELWLQDFSLPPADHQSEENLAPAKSIYPAIAINSPEQIIEGAFSLEPANSKQDLNADIPTNNQTHEMDSAADAQLPGSLSKHPHSVRPSQTIPQWMQLSESRRMRSTELHYLDHPKFGVLLRIDPVKIPEQLSTLWIEANHNSETSLQR
ncbi:MAG: peptidoglycan binding protein CsiV [Pseudomonadales bacterium]|nr:peptidoglycan binding protein CsiV [Pseudomonadales bacterium]